ncbi:hypothetical protein [Mogibacterium pumilum]|nr:hypothetical protein [Mogibacterium pumilum]
MMIAVMILTVMLCGMNAFALVEDQDKPDAGNGNGIITHEVEGEIENPDAYLKPAGTGAVNNIPGSTYTIQVTENGITYTIGYVVRSAKILPEEISGMDSDQALEYIANKSMTFYTDPNTTNIPDIVYGRDYFVRINGSTNIIPETLLGSYKLEVANNSEFKNAATTTVTIGNVDNGGNSGNTNADNADKPNNNVQIPGISEVRDLAKKLSATARPKARGRGALTARASQANTNGTIGANASNSANNASNSDNENSSISSSASLSQGGVGNGVGRSGSNRALDITANAATAGAGVGSFWLTVLIISDVKLLLWYKKLKEAKRKSAA